jgi:predicted hydrocarbon binding protein
VGNTIKFISYGNEKYVLSRGRIKKEADDLNFFTDICVHTEKTILSLSEYKNAILNENFRKVFQSNRGGGYWMWKPLIVYEELKKLNENDCLFYADAGCTIPNNKKTTKKLKKFQKLVNDHRTGVLSFNIGLPESQYTKGDIFKHFKCKKIPEIYNTSQRMANRFVIRKCDKSVEHIKSWWETALNYPHLFSDRESKTSNFENFRDNRHDQSIWSVLCKIFNVKVLPNHENAILATRIRQ